MKSAHLFPTAWSILFCFAIWKLTSYEPKVTVTCNTEAKCECDTSELVKENKKLRSDLYWKTKECKDLKKIKVYTDKSGKQDVKFYPNMDCDFLLEDRIFKPDSI